MTEYRWSDEELVSIEPGKCFFCGEADEDHEPLGDCARLCPKDWRPELLEHYG